MYDYFTSGWTPSQPYGWTYGTCNCACSRCLQGSCCQFRSGGTTPFTTVSTGTTVSVEHQHRWEAVGLRKGDVIQSCECGEVRRVEVPE